MIKEKKHNGIISIWKFLFSLMIVIFHGAIFKNSHGIKLFNLGYIAVEFFFIVSGYLLAKKALNNTNDTKEIGKETLNYIVKKIKGFLPYVLISITLYIIIINIYTKVSLFDNINVIYNYSLLTMSGIKVRLFNGPIWYISAMLISMTILYPVLRKYKYNYVYIICPLIVIIGLGWMNNQYGTVKTPMEFVGIFYKGLIRGFIELNLGIITYVISERIKSLSFTNFGKLLLTVVQLGCLASPFVISTFCTQKYDFLSITFMAIGITLAFTEKSLDYNICNNKLFFYLERLSLSLYMFHSSIKIIISNSNLLKNLSYTQNMIIYLTITFIVSIIMMAFIDRCKKKKIFENKLLPLIIKKD